MGHVSPELRLETLFDNRHRCAGDQQFNLTVAPKHCLMQMGAGVIFGPAEADDDLNE